MAVEAVKAVKPAEADKVRPGAPEEHGPIRRLLPGLALSAAISVLAYGVQAVEVRLLGRPIIEALVLAILLGTIYRTLRTPAESTQPGVNFAAKRVLEWAIVLLGATVNLRLLFGAGGVLIAGIAGTVALGIIGGTIVGKALGLELRHAVLVACGNAICGNSAIAAIAPVIGARREHVASAIAFTAVLGVVVILTLPFAIPLLGLSYFQYGALAGMTVYAVPQVLAAAFPVSQLSGQVGTMVKLVRVLLLGPVVLILALTLGERAPSDAKTSFLKRAGQLVPWFIIGFLILGALRTAGVLGDATVAPLRVASQLLTVLAMAGLGLGVDARDLRRAGRKVVLTVCGSLAVIITASAFFVRTLAG